MLDLTPGSFQYPPTGTVRSGPSVPPGLSLQGRYFFNVEIVRRVVGTSAGSRTQMRLIVGPPVWNRTTSWTLSRLIAYKTTCSPWATGGNLFFLFLPRHVSVRLWQFGHNAIRLDLISFWWFPSICSNSKVRGLPNHVSILQELHLKSCSIRTRFLLL